MKYLYYRLWRPFKRWILYKSPIAPFLGYDRRISNEGWPRTEHRDEITGHTFSQMRKLSIERKELYGVIQTVLEDSSTT